MNIQESIPIGCVPSAAVAAGGGGSSAHGGVWQTPPCEQNDCPVGGCLPRGCLPEGMFAEDVCPWECLPRRGLPREVSAWGLSTRGVSAEWGCPADIPPCEQNDWQTCVKTLPCHNYVADGNKPLKSLYRYLSNRCFTDLITNSAIISVAIKSVKPHCIGL